MENYENRRGRFKYPIDDSYEKLILKSLWTRLQRFEERSRTILDLRPRVSIVIIKFDSGLVSKIPRAIALVQIYPMSPDATLLCCVALTPSHIKEIICVCA